MAITTDAGIEFFGSETDYTGTNSTVAAGAYSVAADIDDFTNSDDADMAGAMLRYLSTSAPTAGGYVSLYGILKNIRGTADESVPTASDESAHFFGDFLIPNATDSYNALRISLPNMYTSQVYEFYLKNNTDQTMLATWEFWLTPVAKGPHA